MSVTFRGSRPDEATTGTSDWWQFAGDAVAWGIALAVGATLAVHDMPDRLMIRQTLILYGVAVLVLLGAGLAVKLYQNRYWAGSVEEARTLTLVLLGAGVVASGVALLARLPISPVMIATPLAICLSLGLRYLRRQSVDRTRLPMTRRAKRTLIYGAGNLGRMTIQRMLSDPRSPYYPVGIIDDDPATRNRVVRDVPVLGSFHDLPAINEALGVSVIVVAIDAPPSDLLTRLVGLAPALDVEVKVVPTLERSLGRQTVVGPVRDIRIDDLMEHRTAGLDIDSMRGYLGGKRVLVTGAGGSIGQELCLQVRKLGCSDLVLVDHDETHLQDTEFALYGTGLLMRDDIVLADIRDRGALRAVFDRWRPDVVFHAAALKHVPMLERFPREAWNTNVLGTLNVLECAHEAGVQTFINISTDKAAAPTTILGHSKRMAEHLTSWMGAQSPGRYVSVRFGNVFGSRGSMVPLFQKSIEAGLPIRITHEDATRYFMTTSEACELVIAAGAEGANGEVMILDMGSPVRILDVAQRLVDMSGKDIPIEVVGIRPGEKLHEVLVSDDDALAATTTTAEGTIRARVTPVDPAELDYDIWLASVRDDHDGPLLRPHPPLAAAPHTDAATAIPVRDHVPSTERLA